MNYYNDPYQMGNNNIQNTYGLQQQPRMYINGTFVGSLEEAQRCVIPSDGMIYCFPDLTNNVIYTKQVNMLDGRVIFRVFESKPQQTQPDMMANNNSVTRQEFDALSNKLQTIIDQLGGNANV